VVAIWITVSIFRVHMLQYRVIGLLWEFTFHG
jgi:hypothetical protein